MDAIEPRPADRPTGGTPGNKANNKASSDLDDAWRLAFVVVVDVDLATRAVSKAFLDASSEAPVSTPTRLELLAATLRLSLTRAADNPDRPSDSAVTSALWQLPATQRAALWLAKVNELDTASLASVLSLTTANAVHVATRAAEWLDVALDHESGPLCPYEGLLADFIDGTLDDDEAAEFEEHVPGCHTCRSKFRAFEELSDLKTVLLDAIPSPPAGLSVETMDTDERTQPSDGPASLVEPRRRTPAVRPLAACCAALLIVGLIGLVIVRPARSSSDPTGSSDPTAIVPGLSPAPVIGADLGSSSNLPAGAATTVVVTTTSVPAVTFPTLPAGGSKKTRR